MPIAFPNRPDPSLTLAEALALRRPALQAMPERDVRRQLKLDVTDAVLCVLGSLPRIAMQRDAMVAQFGAGAGTLVDELYVSALAAQQADAERRMAPVVGSLARLEAEVRAEYTLLLCDAESLVNRKLLDVRRLRPARSTRGYRALIQSTLVLVAVLREQWSVVSGSTPLTTNDLARSQHAAEHMLRMLSERDANSRPPEAIETCARALTALVTHYDRVRRMISFLRWDHGDADEIAPSLFARRSRRKRVASEERATSTRADIVAAEEHRATRSIAPELPRLRLVAR